ncbi:hypothetical protein HDU76_005401 [Blyttiomyces sp. JEL0837]|nr:hypothetical protein HDU76_005401 [Blyttiomyces sp. JEL0837]
MAPNNYSTNKKWEEEDASSAYYANSSKTLKYAETEVYQNGGEEYYQAEYDGQEEMATDTEGYNDEIYDIVDTIVPRTDDPSTPAMTFRVFVLGTLFSVLFAFANTLLTFRQNQISINPFIGVLISYPLGVLMSKILPVRRISLPFTSFRFSLNPGPFSLKEHTLIFVLISTAAVPAYSLYNIIGQKYILQQPLDPQTIQEMQGPDGNGPVFTPGAVAPSTGWCIAFTLVTQCFGYGLAGLMRRFLVRPATMLWPPTLSVMALLRSIHAMAEDKSSHQGPWRVKAKQETTEESSSWQPPRMAIFWMFLIGSFVYQWFPSYIAPSLSAVSILCYIAPNNNNIKLWGSAQQGVGLLSFTFDWSIIASASPIITPLWALLNQGLGIIFFLWIVLPILFYTNAFGKDQQLGADKHQGPNGTGLYYLGHGLNTAHLFDDNGIAFPSSLLLNPLDGLTLNEDFYNMVKPVRISTYFALEYACGFLVFAAALSHVVLWYGKDIWARFKSGVSDLDANDVHARLMDAYPEVPDSWYLLLLTFTVILSIACTTSGGFDLPWWGTFLALAIGGITILPIGTITAISGQNISLSIISELIIGFLLPGRFISVMTFKTLSYMSLYQGTLFVQDLKLGHYMKVPPRAMFFVQVWGTLIASFVNVYVAVYVFEHLGDKINQHLGGWNAAQYNAFISTGAIWGALGPAKFFGPGSPYFKTLLAFIVGLIAPLIPYTLHHLFPNSYWHLVNIPLIAFFPATVSTMRSDLITPLLVAIFVNHFIKKWKSEWWHRNAYVMSAALDTGSAVALTVIFFGLIFQGVNMPFWTLNRVDVEHCAPDYYLTCVEHMIKAGPGYNASNDIEVCQTFGMLARMQ